MCVCDCVCVCARARVSLQNSDQTSSHTYDQEYVVLPSEGLQVLYGFVLAPVPPSSSEFFSGSPDYRELAGSLSLARPRTLPRALPGPEHHAR